jgi:hypothetical protein
MACGGDVHLAFRLVMGSPEAQRSQQAERRVWRQQGAARFDGVRRQQTIKRIIVTIWQLSRPITVPGSSKIFFATADIRSGSNASHRNVQVSSNACITAPKVYFITDQRTQGLIRQGKWRVDHFPALGRATGSSYGISFAKRFLPREITMVSPWITSCSKADKWVFASWVATNFMEANHPQG